MSVRRRRGRKRATGTRAPILVEARPNARWSVDFVHDQFASGRRFRILNVIDDVTKECLAAIPDTSISGRRVARELTDVIGRRGKPDLIVSDNGTEFTSNAMLAWTQEAGVAWHFIAPGKPMQNGICEAFNGRMRDELLNETLFYDLDHARAVVARWVDAYNRTATAFGARLPDTGGLRRLPHRNGRSAPQPRPAPPIVRCSTGATAPISTVTSGSSRMNERGHSSGDRAAAGPDAVTKNVPDTAGFLCEFRTASTGARRRCSASDHHDSWADVESAIYSFVSRTRADQWRGGNEIGRKRSAGPECPYGQPRRAQHPRSSQSPPRHEG